MNHLEFDNGISIKEVVVGNVDFRISAFTGALKLIQGASEKKIQQNTIPNSEYRYTPGESVSSFSGSNQFSFQYSKVNESQTFSYLESYELFEVSAPYSYEKTNALNINIIRKTSKAPYPAYTVVIPEVVIKEGALNLHQKLVNHRVNIEKYGIIIGLFLGFFSLAPPLLYSIDWTATIPASILFFSLPAFVFIRKQLREGHD